MTFTNKSFRSLIVSFNKSNEFVASKRSWEETRDKLLEYLVTKHQKLESSTLYTQNYISDFEKVSNQLLVCFIVYCIIRIHAMNFESVFSSKRWRLSLFTYKINLKHAKTTSWAYRLLFHLHFLNIKSFTQSSSQLSFQWFQFQISRISLQTSSNFRYFYSYQRSRESQSLSWQDAQNLEHLLASFSLFQCSWYLISRNDVSHYLIASICDQISNWNSKTFSSFFLCINY